MRYRDLGIGTFLRSGPQTFPNPNQPDWLSLAPTVDGQQQVMTATSPVGEPRPRKGAAGHGPEPEFAQGDTTTAAASTLSFP
jgi:hypothetical protein